ISHDLHIVMAETDTVVCLNQHVCCAGAPENVAGSHEYQQLFGPQAADALAVYRHMHDHEHAEDGQIIHHGCDSHAHNCAHDHPHTGGRTDTPG
ncbi:MAG: zinc ABC transporter ATP-binding protein, partial [Hyphomicrobiales bacterium]|nr:zinc ABC transporter ATP-binding protein [Hyphomicrobiales bacterium]